MTLQQRIPKNEQPREKLLHNGAEALSDSELLAILLRTGYKGVNVVDLAKSLIQDHGGLQPLLKLTKNQFCKIRGLGETSYLTLQASLALAARMIESKWRTGEEINSSTKARDYIRMRMAGETREVFAVMFLNNQNQMLQFRKLFFGSISSAEVHPAEVIRNALEICSNKLIIAHNHPGGDATPSDADDKITHKIAKAAKLLDISLLDHIIVGNGGFYSYAENKADLLL